MLFRRRAGSSAPRRRRIRKLRLVALLGVLALLALLSFTLGALTAVASEVPKLDPHRQQDRQLNGYVYDRDGERILAVLRGDENRVLVDYDEISPWLKHAVVALEDRRFWDHDGIDLRGIARALWADIRHQKLLEGGSTITQQFVKLNYGSERSFARKVREAALAWQLERHPDWPKKKILAEYLNTIYFGHHAYGVQQAARIYFGRGAADLRLHEAALLAGVVANPSAYDPIRFPEAARERRDVALRAMLEEGYITRADLRRASAAPLPTEIRIPGSRGPAPYFTDYVLQQLLDRYGAKGVYGQGFRIRTTIDLKLQDLAQKAMWKVLEEKQGPSASLVAIDPDTGDVLAMVGGRSYRQSQFNLAVQSMRQPGSAFKPFVLATALEQGISPATVFESKQTVIPLGDRVWVVNNYEDAYAGQTTLAEGTVHSDNAVYAQLTQLVTPKAVARTAHRLGTRALAPYFSIGLGAQAVSPVELARAYTAFANGGYRIDTKTFGDRPRVVRSIEGPDGVEVVPENDQLSNEVLKPRTAAWVNELLSQVIERGTGERASLAGWSAAGKTGTTENYGDAWFVGYTPELAVAVWVGYPTKLKPMLTEFEGEPVAGGSYPAMIWKSFMEKALGYLGAERESFEPPPSEWTAPQLVVQRDGRIQRDNGLCRNRREVVYFAGFEPRGIADCKENEVQVPHVVGQKVAAAEARLEQQPLTPVIVYTWAKPGQPIGVVLDQSPRKGAASSYDDVTLVLGRARHGVVPRLTGKTLAEAQARLERAKLRVRVTRRPGGRAGTVLAQKPEGGVAASRGMAVELVVADG